MGKKSYKTELREILQKIPDDQQLIAQHLMNELLFLHDTLEKLHKEVEEGGVTEHFQNGKQDFIHEAPALTSYNKTIARYGQLYKQLNSMIPKKAGKPEGGNAVYEFLKEHQE